VELRKGNYKVNIAPSDLVDFGGQKSFDMTHQLFIQHKGEFILMFNGSFDFCDPSDLDTTYIYRDRCLQNNSDSDSINREMHLEK
jgi:hypothetical protein